MDVEFEQLSLSVDYSIFNWGRKETKILKSVSGRFRAGELSAILGPSGAGKTSLLNALSGYRSSGIKGLLKLNGQPRNEKKFRKMSCYITQENDLVQYLSLNEVMRFAASLKLPSNYTGKQKKSVVEEIQNMLGLTDCKGTRTDALSGGQKKRLSIALELINNPPILFLDEPTSGLDHVTSSIVLKLLRSLAHQGRTIVCTIHQPSASLFALFDHVYVLAAGVCIYQGATLQIVPFLKNSAQLECPTHYNPADYIIELAEKEKNISTMCKAIENGQLSMFNTGDVNSSQMAKSEKNENGSTTDRTSLFNYSRLNDEFKKGNCSDFFFSNWIQFYALLCRMLLQAKRNNVGLKIQFFNHFCCSIALGIMFYQMGKDGTEFFNQIKLCVGVVVFLTYTQCMIPVLSYPFEIKILKKEHFNQWYGLCPYYLAFTVSKVPGIAFFSMMYLIIVYIMFGLPLEFNRFATFCTISLIVAFAAEGLGLMIGSIFSVTNGAAVGPLILTPIFGFSVYGLDFARTIPPYLGLLLKTSFMRIGVYGLYITFYGMDRETLKCSAPDFCYFQDPKVALYFLGIEGNTSPWQEITILFALLLSFRFAFYLGLWWRLRT